MIEARITRPATLHRWSKSTSKNALGDYTATFTDVPTFVEIQQVSSIQVADGRQLAVTQEVAYFRPSEVLGSNDELTVDGIRYSFNGKPWLVRNPRTGINSHWLARLKTTAG